MSGSINIPPQSPSRSPLKSLQNTKKQSEPLLTLVFEFKVALMQTFSEGRICSVNDEIID